MKKLIFVFHLILLANLIKGQLKQEQVDILDSILLQYKENYELSGLAVGVIKGNNISYINCFGKKDINTEELITPHSVFHVASLSKNFTATAIMKLVEDGKLSLDDKLFEILPYFKLKDERYKQITIKQILLHTSGIRDIKDYEWDKPKYKLSDVQEYLKGTVDTLKLDFTPGEKDRYSNLAFDYLADVVLKCSGKSFEEYVKENILDPLEMKNSTFSYPEVDPSKRTRPHTIGDDFYLKTSKIYPFNRIHTPSSTMQSSISDMMNWAKFNIQNGAFKNRQILKKEFHNEITSEQLILNPHISFGLSWAISPYQEKKMIYNSGCDLGFRSFMAFIPEDTIAVVVLSNCMHTPGREIAFTAINIVNGRKETKPLRPLYLTLGKVFHKRGVEGVKEEYFNLKANKSPEYMFNDVNLNNLARQLINQNRLNEAIEILKLNIVIHPESAFCYSNLAGCYKMQKSHNDALENYKKALNLRPNDKGIKREIKNLEIIIGGK